MVKIVKALVLLCSALILSANGQDYESGGVEPQSKPATNPSEATANVASKSSLDALKPSTVLGQSGDMTERPPTKGMAASGTPIETPKPEEVTKEEPKKKMETPDTEETEKTVTSGLKLDGTDKDGGQTGEPEKTEGATTGKKAVPTGGKTSSDAPAHPDNSQAQSKPSGEVTQDTGTTEVQPETKAVHNSSSTEGSLMAHGNQGSLPGRQATEETTGATEKSKNATVETPSASRKPGNGTEKDGGTTRSLMKTGRPGTGNATSEIGGQKTKSGPSATKIKQGKTHIDNSSHRFDPSSSTKAVRPTKTTAGKRIQWAELPKKTTKPPMRPPTVRPKKVKASNGGKKEGEKKETKVDRVKLPRLDPKLLQFKEGATDNKEPTETKDEEKENDKAGKEKEEEKKKPTAPPKKDDTKEEDSKKENAKEKDPKTTTVKSGAEGMWGGGGIKKTLLLLLLPLLFSLYRQVNFFLEISSGTILIQQREPAVCFWNLFESSS